MKRYDMSQFDFSALVFPRKTKTFKNVIQLYCECKYEEAEALSEKLKGYDPQLADMKAQTAFFRCDFNECVKNIMEFYPFLIEWYSGNKKWDTEKMLEYALQKADKDIKQEAIEILMEMYNSFSSEQLDIRGFEHFKYIPTLIEHANGVLEDFANPYHIYSPPETPQKLNAIIDDYLLKNKKRFANLKGDPMDDPAIVNNVLLLIENNGYPEDFLKIYSEHFTSPFLIYTHLEATKIYLYLKQEDKARDTLVNYAKYSWIPVESTDIKPLSMFVDYSFVPLFNKELFDIIYHLPVPHC